MTHIDGLDRMHTEFECVAFEFFKFFVARNRLEICWTKEPMNNKSSYGLMDTPFYLIGRDQPFYGRLFIDGIATHNQNVNDQI